MDTSLNTNFVAPSADNQQTKYVIKNIIYLKLKIYVKKRKYKIFYYKT